MEKIVTGCEDCPFVFNSGHGHANYSCIAPGAKRLLIVTEEKGELDKSIHLITPDWCPLLTSPITITLNKK